MALSNPATGQQIVAEINKKLDASGGNSTGDMKFQGRILVNTICDTAGNQMLAKTDKGVVGKDNVPIAQIVSGIYTGDGQSERTINLGFTPTWVFVYPRAFSYPGPTWLITVLEQAGLAVGSTGQCAADDSYDWILNITRNGFNVYYGRPKDADGNTVTGSQHERYTNRKSYIYKYIAGI